jgi:hypothetical protein
MSAAIARTSGVAGVMTEGLRSEIALAAMGQLTSVSP